MSDADDPFACFGGDDSDGEDDASTEAAAGGADTDKKEENGAKATQIEKISREAIQAQRLRQEAEARQTYAKLASSPASIQPLHTSEPEKYANRFEVYECSHEDGYDTGQKGVRATKSYKVGEEILREYPAMCTSHPASSPEEAEDKFRRAVQESYDACSEITKAAIMELSSCREDNAPGGEKTLHAIFSTNTYALGQGATYGGLFLSLSRLNHSCRPNCVHHWRPDKHCLIVHAVRDIEEGEELYTCYGPGDCRLTSERQEYLVERYNFRCFCDMCQEGSDVKNDGDKLEYERINRFHDNLPMLTSRDPEKAIAKVEECLELLQQLQMGEAHFIPILHFGYVIARDGLRDLDQGRSYLKREVTALEHSQGSDSYGAIDARELLNKFELELG